MDLSGCYVIEVNPQHVNSLTYNTNSQSGVRMQYGDISPTRRVYYVAASDEPTVLTIYPNSGDNVQFGIKSITDESGNVYSSAPRRTTMKTSELTVGKPIVVNSVPLNEILTGKLIVNYHNPEGVSTETLRVAYLTGNHYNVSFTFKDFNNNSIEIPYDPVTEATWYIQNKNRMFAARDEIGQKLSQSLTFSGGSSDGNYSYTVRLPNEPGTHTIDVYASVVPMDVPMTFEFENSTGNEKNPEYLADMIESLTINGKKLTDKSWLNPGFTVPNGAKMKVGIKQQYKGIWEWEKSWFNGSSLIQPSSEFAVEAVNADEVQTFKIRGMYNSNWRYTLVMTNPSRTKLEVDGNMVSIPEGVSTYNGTAGFSAPALRPMGYNSTSEENPLAIYEVVVDGQTIALDENGCYYPKEKDEVITVTPREYKREVPIQLYCNLGYYSQYTITLDPRGQAKKIVPLKDGWQTIMVNPGDLPFQTYSDDAAIYVNGSQTPLSEQEGYGIFTGLRDLAANSKVKLYTSRPRIYTVGLYVENGLSCNIYADDEKISTGDQSMLYGTEVRFVPTQKSGLVLEKLDGTLIEPESDGSFKLEITSYETYTLHRENAKITISCPSEMNIQVQNPVNNSKVMLKGIVNEPYTFHYDANANQTYTLKFIDPSGKNRVSNITASPSAGFKFDPATATASGIKDGMSLSLEVSEYIRPYSYDLWVSPGHNMEGSESELSVVYMENGEKKLQKLNYGDNKKELSADNFPISIGAYIVSFRMGEVIDPQLPPPIIEEITWDTSYGSGQRAIINGEEHQFYQGEDNGIIIQEPTQVEGKIYDEYEITGIAYWNNPFYVEFSYSLNGKPFERYEAPSSSYPDYGYRTMSIYQYSYLDVHIDPNTEDLDLYEMVVEDPSSNTTNRYPFDSQGNVHIEFPKTEEGFNDYNDPDSSYKLYIHKDQIVISFQDTDGHPYSQLSVVAGGKNIDDTFDLMFGTYLSRPVDELYLSGLIDLYSEPKRMVCGVYDVATNEDLEFDWETRRVPNLQKYVRDGKVELGLRFEPYLQPYKVTVYLDNTSYNSSNNYIMAKGREAEFKGSVTNGLVINYNNDELPINLKMESRSGMTTNLTFKTPNYYLNGELYMAAMSKGGTIQNPPTMDYPSLPFNLIDGSIVRIMQTSNTSDVAYSVEDGLDVAIYQDVQQVGDPSMARALAKGTIIKVVPAEGPEVQEYVVYRNDVKLSKEEAANGFAVAEATETIRVEKPRNVITFVAGASTDLIDLVIADNLGNIYQLTADNKVLQLPQTVESLTILSSVENQYISDISSDQSSMTYDVTTGVLSGLISGTLTVTSKAIEREQEVGIYIDGGEVDGVQITLGSGTQIETGQSLNTGSQTVQFSEEDLPIILRLPDSYIGEDGSVPNDPAKLPTVMVNGEILSYSPEHNGYVFPVEAFADPSNPPVIKIYPAAPQPAEVTYLVEPGVTFTAIPDGEETKAVSEAGTVELLPGTQVVVTARSTKANEEIFVEVNGEVQTEGKEITYNFQVGSEGQTIELKRKKVAVTINSDEAWRFVHVSGGGFNYPLYDVASELEFPVGTTQLTLRSKSDNERVIKVINATTGDELPFDIQTGIVSGITDKMKLSLETGDLSRDNELTIYLEESDNMPHTTLMIAEGKAVEKEIWLQNGYQKMLFAHEDLPMAIKCEQPLKVYLNNMLLDYDETDGYAFPAEFTENSVVKVFMAEQPVIKVNYNIEGAAFDVEVRHDHAGVIDTSLEHQVFPGTEITFTVDPKTLQARLKAAREAGDLASVNGNTEVTVNGEALAPGEDGIYTFKVAADHVAEGLNFVVKRPDYVDPSGCVYSADRTTLISVSPDAEGKVTVLPGVTTIAEGAFKNCNKVISVELPESLETIGKDAFSGCSAITEIIVPNNVTSVGEGAFSGCSNLQTVVLGSSVETVAEDAFTGCDKLTKSAYPKSLGESPFPAQIPAVAYETENPVVDENGYIYAEEEGSKTLIFVPATVSGVVTVPEDVTAIGENAFIGCGSMTAVVVPDNVKEIGEGAFKDCAALETVVIGAGVETVAPNAFENCTGIEEAIYPAAIKEQLADTFPETVTTIPYTATSVELGEDGIVTGKPTDGEGKVLVYVPSDLISEEGKYTIPEDITEIGTGAFTACDNLTEITIPDSVGKIDDGAFNGCGNLSEITIGEGVKEIGENAFSGTAITQIVIPDSVTEIGEGAFKDCAALETVVIGAGVETVAPNAFENCDKIKEAIYPADIKEQLAETFPETVTTIPYTASSIEVGEDGVITGKPAEDEGKVLVYVPETVVTETGTYTIPEDITEIGSSAFTGCDNLTEISIPDNVEKIGEGAFSGCDNLTDIELGNGVTEIGDNAFSGTGISHITIPESVTTIGDGAFSDCSNLTELDIPDTVENLGEGVMSGCENLSKVTIPEGVEEIGADEFKGCTSLTEVTIPESVTTIGAGAFEGCTNLETIVIPETVTTIGENAFSGCESLTEITLPETVNEIGNGAFTGCTNLEKINIPEGVSTIGDNAFNGCGSLTEITLPETVTEISAGAFQGCEKLETVNIPENVTEIGADAFKGCSELTTIAVPPTVETIGEGAFEDCENLTKFVYPDTFSDIIGEGTGVAYPADEAQITEDGVILTAEAIYFVPADVKEVEIPQTVTTIEDNAFRDCKELTTVDIPQNVTEIGANAFNGCSSLTEITIPNQVSAIEEGAFSGCEALTEVNLGNSVTSIGENAFHGCVALKEINVHSNVTEIGAGAFSNCGLTDIHLGAGIHTIGAGAFAGNPVTTIAITAQSAPILGENALGDTSSARLYVQGDAAVNAYRAAAGWNSFNPAKMVVATQIDAEEEDVISLKHGESIQLHVSVYPENATLGAIFWESSNPAVLTVDNKGLVTLVGEKPLETMSLFSDEAPLSVTASTMYDDGPKRVFFINDMSTGICSVIIGSNLTTLEKLLREGAVYTLDGIKIDTKADRLDPGVYVIIIDGKSTKITLK